MLLLRTSSADISFTTARRRGDESRGDDGASFPEVEGEWEDVVDFGHNVGCLWEPPPPSYPDDDVPSRLVIEFDPSR